MNVDWILRLMSGVAIATLSWGYILPAQAQQPPQQQPQQVPNDSTVTPLPPPAVTATTQRCRRRLVRGQCLRLRATFFEEERRLRYGFTDFPEAALDGASNSINSRFDPDTLNTDPVISANPDQLPGTLTIVNRNSNSANFLQGTFVAANRQRVRINQANPDDGNPQTGDVTLTVNGIPGFTNGRYRAGYSQRGDRATGSIEITNVNNPNQVLMIQIPETDIPANQRSFNSRLRRPATLSIGRPVDR